VSQNSKQKPGLQAAQTVFICFEKRGLPSFRFQQKPAWKP